MSTAVINGLLEELAGQGIRLTVQRGELVARGPAGAMTAELAERVKRHKPALVAALTARPGAPVPPVAERSLFDDLATPPVAQPVEATAPAAAITPAVAAPVEPTPQLARTAPVTPPASDAPAVESLPGWPADVPPPDWWGEFCSILGGIKILAARAQVCGDSACAFPVMIEWEAPGCPREWSCPRCGRAAPPVADPPEAQQPAVEIIEWRYPTTPRPGFRVKPRACGWCGPDTEWWQDDKSRWRCVRCDPPAPAVAAEVANR